MRFEPLYFSLLCAKGLRRSEVISITCGGLETSTKATPEPTGPRLDAGGARQGGTVREVPVPDSGIRALRRNPRSAGKPDDSTD